ncbi:LysR substrate-binding domain-containing protein [Kitasatospora sp. NPDC059327]|uniref:LysR substrate-binding domain-containing protein n=1 Tax=Kitasatospora sp. NPDC059327 TaxID=3346803 RepID=UPI0036B53B0B
MPALGEPARSHPELEPRVVERETAEPPQELRTGGIDLVIAEEDGPGPADPWPGLVADPVADDEYRVVIPTSWHRQPRSVRDLAERPWATGPQGSACGRAPTRISAEYGFPARRAHVCVEFPAVLALVAAGHDAAIAPTPALGGSPPEGEVGSGGSGSRGWCWGADCRCRRTGRAGRSRACRRRRVSGSARDGDGDRVARSPAGPSGGRRSRRPRCRRRRALGGCGADV